MKSFKEHEAELSADSPDTSEAMTMQQRMKAKATFRKNKAKIALGKKKAAKRLASDEKIKARSVKKARELIIKKLLKNKKSYGLLSPKLVNDDGTTQFMCRLIPNVLNSEECNKMINDIWDYFECITKSSDKPIKRNDKR